MAIEASPVASHAAAIYLPTRWANAAGSRWANTRSEPVGKLDDHALANRLSYFLWATMPDDELFPLAREKKLSDPKVLRAQTDRMLREPKAERFVTDFTNQLRGCERRTGRRFADIREFKPLLLKLKDEPQIARNFAEQLLGYATGAPLAFSNRAAVAKAETTTGLRVVVGLLNKPYATGRKCVARFNKAMKIVFDPVLPKWNSIALPEPP